MSAPRSISGRLIRSLTAVSLVGATLLLIFIVIEYRISFSHLSNGPAFGQALHEVAEHVVLPMALLAIPMAVAGRWAIRSAVRPLTVAAHRIEAASDQPRGVRLDVDALPAEAQPFAQAINGLLVRVDQAAGLHEAFAADIAHELRTPLTLISLELEGVSDPAAGRVREDVASLRRLIDQLILLAQIDAQQAAQIPPERIDLADLAADIVAQLAPAALDQDRQLALEAPVRTMIAGRREAIGAALRNLIENALRVTPRSGTVTIGVRSGGCLYVRDEGEGLSNARLKELTARLRRADHASRDGAGLGLAIVARIVAAHQGKLISDPDRREICLKFPESA